MMRVIKWNAGHNTEKWTAIALFALLALLFTACFGTGTSHAAEDFNGIVKVRLTPTGQSSDIRVVPHGKYYIKESSRTQLLDVEYKVHLSGSSVQLKYGSTVLYSGSKLTLVRASGNTEKNFIVFPASPTQGTRTNYYGNIEFSVNSGLCAVNHVYIEDYLLGVVPYEMSPSWPTNALKAQAVCARNYAVREALANPLGTYQLWDTTRSQVYKGVPGVSSTGTINYTTYNTIKNVVNGTSRKVMKYDDTVFSAYYSAWNGGETLSVPGWTGNTLSKYGYTTVRTDPYDDERCKDAYWIRSVVDRYLESSGDDINKDVQDMLIRNYKRQYDVSSDVTFIFSSTGIKGEAPNKEPEVSLVYENFYSYVRFNTESGTKKVTYSDSDLKQALGISSSYCAFRIVHNSTKGITTLYNVRYGHGVGMSQRGAQQMANEGKSYADILHFYYKDITFSTLSVSSPSLPSLPGGSTPTVQSIDSNSIRLTWNAVSGADGYKIYRKTSSAAYEVIKDGVTSTSFTDNSLNPGKAYYYKVRPYVLDDGSPVYGTITKPVYVKPVLEAPTGVKAVSNSYNSVRLTWNAVSEADGYRIYRKTSSTSYKVIKDGLTGTGYTSGGLSTGTTYYYKVRPYTLVGSTRVYGTASTYVRGRPVAAVPTGVAAVPYSSSSVRLVWNAVSGADGYRIYRKTLSTSYKVIKDGLKATGYTDRGLSEGTTYYYKVRPYTQKGSKRVYGTATTYVRGMPEDTVPTGVQAESCSYNSVRLTWNAANEADGYRIYRKTSTTSYKVVKDGVTGTAYTNGGLNTGTTYYYKVRSYIQAGSQRVYVSASTYVRGKPVAAAPTSVKAVSSSYNSVRLTWDAVAGADGYRIYRKTSSTSYTVIKDGLTGTGYTNGGLSTGTTYYYKVRPYTLLSSTRVYGTASTYVSAKPVPSAPEDVTASRTGATSVKIDWAAVAGASGYDVSRMPEGGSYALLESTAALTCTDDGAEEDTSYTYKVRAYRMVGETKVTGSFSDTVLVP